MPVTTSHHCMESVRPRSVCFEDYLIECEQPEYLPSGRDCGSYHGEVERQLDWRLYEAAEIWGVSPQCRNCVNVSVLR